MRGVKGTREEIKGAGVRGGEDRIKGEVEVVE